MCCNGLSCACYFLYVRPQVEIESFQVWRTECLGVLTYTACLPVYIYIYIKKTHSTLFCHVVLYV